jgi:hypothetical protein
MSSVEQIDGRYSYEPLRSGSHIRLLRIKGFHDGGEPSLDRQTRPRKLKSEVKEEDEDESSSAFDSSSESETHGAPDSKVPTSNKHKIEDGFSVPRKRLKVETCDISTSSGKSDTARKCRAALSLQQLSLIDLAFDTVQISLEERHTVYDTVSYVWGSPTRTCHVTVDDYPFPITSSLANALPQLVNACQTGFLWIDQLCINQDDIEERNQQVGIMGSIYEQSHQCLVPFSLDETFGTGKTNLFWPEGEEAVLTLQRFKNIGEESCYHMTNWIYRHEWFQRVWIFQEVVLAPNPLVLIGRWKIPFEVMDGLNGLIKTRLGKENAKKILPGYTFVEVVSRLREHPRLIQPTKVVTIDTLLNELANSKCSDPRDHIFAFLAVAIRQYDHFDVKVDYSLSVPRTFAMATRAIIQIEGLSFFSFLDASQGWNDGEILPSWCPNWQRRVTAVTFPLDEPQVAYADWSRDRAVLYRSPKWTELVLSGALIDTVSTVHQGNTMKDLSIEIGRAQSVKRNARTMHNNRSRQHERFNLDEATQRKLRKALDGVRTIRAYNNGKGDKEDAARVLTSWRVISSVRGAFGLAPAVTKIGDRIALIHGAKQPVLLRLKGRGRPEKSTAECKYTIQGECFYGGTVQAELEERIEPEFEKITLV